MTTLADCEKLLALSEKATEGPWQQNGSHIYGPDPQRLLVAQINYIGRGYQEESAANEELLKAARNDGPEIAKALVEAMKRLRSKQRASCREKWCKCEDCLMVTEFFGEQWYDSGEGR